MDRTNTAPSSALESEGRAVALREPETPEQERLIDAFLSEYPGGENQRRITTFPSYHDDRLDVEARKGRFGRVVFANLEAFLTAVWKGHLHFDEWIRAGVEIELIASPVLPAQLRDFLSQTCASYADFRRRLRRRQTIAAMVMTAFAVAAMAAMIWVIPAVR